MPDVAPAPPRRRNSTPVRTSPKGRGVGTFARWPLDAEDGYPSPSRDADPWTRLVRESMELYRRGRVEDARRLWGDDIVWRVWGGADAELRGPEAIFGYHAELGRMSDGTFRQQLLAVEGSWGPIVTAYLRTRAERRDGRTLDLPTLLTFECGRMRIQRVVELPGDIAMWNEFWAD